MPKEIYNEGRVVGYSQYELYVKHALSENPDEQPAGEREWLASTLGDGLSLIYKFEPEPDNIDGIHTITIPLPEKSKLIACTEIIGSIFFGECEVDNNGWATKITDYGQGISNTEELHPESTDDPNTYPEKPATKFTKEECTSFLQFIKIQDAVVLQAGAWRETTHHNPTYDLLADIRDKPVIRFTFVSRIAAPFYILLSGFHHRSILYGETGVDSGSTEKLEPENGDFLGPTIFPWANKVILTYPGTITYYLRDSLKSTYLNLDINNDDNSIDTIFTASYLRPSKNAGISIDGPHTPGGDIIIGAKMSPEVNNFLKVEQKDSTVDQTEVTTLTHSKLIPGNGVAINGPASPAADVNISSVIRSVNNYIKVDQNSSTNLGAVTTILTHSNISGNNPISVVGPTSPAGNISISLKLNPGTDLVVRPGGLDIDEEALLGPLRDELLKHLHDDLGFDDLKGDGGKYSIKDLLPDPDEIYYGSLQNSDGVLLDHSEWSEPQLGGTFYMCPQTYFCQLSFVYRSHRFVHAPTIYSNCHIIKLKQALSRQGGLDKYIDWKEQTFYSVGMCAQTAGGSQDYFGGGNLYQNVSFKLTSDGYLNLGNNISVRSVMYEDARQGIEDSAIEEVDICFIVPSIILPMRKDL